MDAKRVRTWLLAVLAVACILRVVLILQIEEPQNVPANISESDAPTYFVLADNLLSGIGYRYGGDLPPTAKRTPGYPLMLAAVFKIFGRNFNAVRGVQCGLDVLTTLLVFVLGVQLFQDKLAAILAALGYAVYPPALLSTTYIMTENLYTFLLVLFVVTCILAFRSKNLVTYAVAGIIFGLATLTRPGVFILPAVMLVVAVIVRPSTWKGFVVMLAALSITILPWTIRNKRDLGRFIPTSTLMGANLYKGNHLPSRGACFWSTDSLLSADLRVELRDASEAERDGRLRAEALRMMLDNKGSILLLTLKKIPRLWLNLGYENAPSKRSLAVASLHFGLLAMAVYGYRRVPPGARHLRFIPLTVILVSTAMYLGVAAVVRFIFPLIPLLLPFSAAGFVLMLGHGRGDR
jgi:4-amino-4-deoxy-L-arabinose transferase-like glycosyltransferase